MVIDELDPTDIVSYEWIEDAGYPSELILGTGTQLTAKMGWGAHDLTLVVTDSQGVTGSVDFVAEVTDSKIDHVEAPGDIWLMAGGAPMAVNLGNAYADDYCSGQVEKSNDAPALFDPGVTRVRWRFDDGRGNVEEHDQGVFVLEPMYLPATRSMLQISGVDVGMADPFEINHITEPTDLPNAITVDVYLILRGPDGEIYSVNQRGDMVAGAVEPRATGASHGGSVAVDNAWLGVLADQVNVPGVYEIEASLVMPGADPADPVAVVARDWAHVELHEE